MSYSTPPATRQGALRLTRRGRIVTVLAILGLLLFAGFAIGRVSASSAATSAPPRTAVVEPGDTMWSIAAKAAPDRDPRSVIAEIRALNHLSSTSLSPGQQLVLPS